MSDPNADFRALLDLTGGVEVRTAEHPEDRRQRHRVETKAFWLIGGSPFFLLSFSFSALSAPFLKKGLTGRRVFFSWFLVEPLVLR
jgi:hypothetical protein